MSQHEPLSSRGGILERMHKGYEWARKTPGSMLAIHSLIVPLFTLRLT